jgi:hypothetical protein
MVALQLCPFLLFQRKVSKKMTVSERSAEGISVSLFFIMTTMTSSSVGCLYLNLDHITLALSFSLNHQRFSSNLQYLVHSYIIYMS